MSTRPKKHVEVKVEVGNHTKNWAENHVEVVQNEYHINVIQEAKNRIEVVLEAKNSTEAVNEAKKHVEDVHVFPDKIILTFFLTD